MKSLSLSRPHLLIVVGIPGSGKTYFAQKFADTFHAPYVNKDHIIKITQAEDGASQLFHYQIEQLLKTGTTVIIDGEGHTRLERLYLTNLAKKAGYTPLFIWVQTDQPTAANRYKKAHISYELFIQRMKQFIAPNSAESPLVISGKHTYASQAKTVLQYLSAPRSTTSLNTEAARSGTKQKRRVTIR